jgi:hypothetical protein
MAGKYSGIERLQRRPAADKTPGSKRKGGYTITPDQFDRNGDWWRKQHGLPPKGASRPRRPYNIYGVKGRDQNV